jgi:hypothetical protein
MVTYCSHAVFLDSDIAFYWVFCRWNEVTRRIEMWISILELNELGEYAAVELHQAKDVNTGGIFQLRQVLSLCFMFSLCPTLTISGGFLIIYISVP